MPIYFDDPAGQRQITRQVLLLCDRWSDWSSGTAIINQKLALELCSYGGVEVFSTVMDWHVLGHVEDTYAEEENFDNPVQLIRFEVAENSDESLTPGDDTSLIRKVYSAFDQNPLPMLRTSAEPLPVNVDVIVGHSMLSSLAAFRLREQLYPNSKVILIFHVIPDDLEWTRDQMSIPITDTALLIDEAEAADIVYSVSHNVYDYFKAKFRSRALTTIDHRLLLPQASFSSFFFELPPHETDSSVPVFHLVAPCPGTDIEDWMGLDIAVCAVGKVAAIMAERAKQQCGSGEEEEEEEEEGEEDETETADQTPVITLTIINVHPLHVAEARFNLRREMATAEAAGAKIVVKEMSTMRATEHDKYLYELSQRRYAVCLLPFRAEPRGFLGCKAHSCGIPTLVSSHAALAPLLSRLVNEPDYFIAPVTRDVAAAKTDAAVWASRIVNILDNLSYAEQLAGQLKEDLRTDEMTRQSYDNFYSHCLEGVGLKFEATELFFVDEPECTDGLDGPRDLDTRRCFNRFLMGALRQGWRVKQHPLQTVEDLRPLIKSLPQLPVENLISRVIDLIEDRSRRIVDVDCDTNSLVVYCTDMDSLRDLWAMCDPINAALRSVIFPRRHPATIPALMEFGLARARTRVSVSGPELLCHKQRLVELRGDISRTTVAE